MYKKVSIFRAHPFPVALGTGFAPLKIDTPSTPLMGANPIQGTLEEVGPENIDFFVPLNSHDRF
jgi:hypothetical protein